VVDLSGVGLFTSARKIGAGAERVGRAAEELGFDAIWVADVRGDLAVLGRLLAATKTVRVGSAIQSIWDLEPEAAAARWAAADAEGPGRAIVGVGVSHSALVERSGQTYDRPLTRLRGYLDALDALEGGGIPATQRMIGANGPKMLQLAVSGPRAH
jgi:alkanesulfonate monooxygenase SsuD/methylene tetrahydromethanopterin reductase-like flavin-dependent oxidoreductase (luciferase family)